jgi:hypothetical protein
MKFIKTLLLIILIGASSEGISQSTKYFRKIIGQPGQIYEFGQSIKQLSDSSYILAGYLGNATDVECFTMHLSSYGNVIGSDSILDSTIWDFYQYIEDINDGNIILGVKRSFNPLLQYVQLTKTTTYGDTLWSKTIYNSSFNSAAYHIQELFDKQILYCGYTTFNNNSWNSNVVKLDSLGTVLFDSTYDEGYTDIALWSEQLPDSNLIIAGSQRINFNDGDGYLKKITNNGITLWKQTYHYPNDIATEIDCFIKYNDNYLVAGSSGIGDFDYNNPLLINCDSSGNVIWMKKLFYPSSSLKYIGNIMKLVKINNNEFVGCGSMFNVPGAPNCRMGLFKVDSLGELKWIRFYTPDYTNSCYAYDMDITADGGFIISGRRDTINGADIYSVKTNCLGFYAKPSANFSVTWNGNDATFYNTSVRADTCIYYFGDGDSALVMLTDTVPIVHQYSGSGPWQAYLLAFACGEIDTIYQTITTGIELLDDFYERTFSVYPNPSTDNINISYQLPQTSAKAEIEIYDLSGKKIISHTCSPLARNLEIDISELPAGSYVAAMVVDGKIRVREKVVILR